MDFLTFGPPEVIIILISSVKSPRRQLWQRSPDRADDKRLSRGRSFLCSQRVPAGPSQTGEKAPFLWHPRSHAETHSCAHQRKKVGFTLRPNEEDVGADRQRSDEDESRSHHGDRWTFCVAAECPRMCVILDASATASVSACRQRFYKYMSECTAAGHVFLIN